MTGKVITREWTRRGPTGRRVKHESYGYDLTANGKRERHFSADWTTATQALTALLERQREIEAGQVERRAERTLGQLADEYLTYKEQRGKRSLKEDRRILAKRLLPAFGRDLPARRLTGPMLAQYEKGRAGQVSAFTVSNELTVVRHMLHLGRRWGYLDAVPEIEMPKKPAGRLRYLEESGIDKLLKACGESRNPYLGPIVAVALNTGMRKAEILGLAWERVDLTGRLRPERAPDALQDEKREAPRRAAQRRRDRGAGGGGANGSGPYGARVQASRRRRVGADPHRVRHGDAARGHRRVPVPRPAPHLRQSLHDARRPALRPQGDARTQRREDDGALRPPEPAPPARRGAEARRVRPRHGT